jgi:hypothetical protein
MSKLKCVLCNKELEPVHEDGKYNQVYDGGEIRLRFCFGSAKFDLCPGVTDFDALICDECAEPLIKKMACKLYGMDGKVWSEEIQAELNKEIFREWDEQRTVNPEPPQ